MRYALVVDVHSLCCAENTTVDPVVVFSAMRAILRKLPSYFQPHAPSPNKAGEVQRMCASCASILGAKLHWLVNALSVMPVNFVELFRLRELNSSGTRLLILF